VSELGRWVEAGRTVDLPEGRTLAVTVDGRSVLLARYQGQVYALGNRCVHLGCSLTRGALDGYWLTCPCHDWRFDIRSAQFEFASEIRLPRYEAIERDGRIVVNA
jgi:3-phenylpropionate/trans-cinnamate dioxygenase ferredoxin subunit